MPCLSRLNPTMNPALKILLLAISLFAINADAGECEGGWVAYKDTLCVKTFPTTFATYDEAKEFCSSQGTEQSKSSLVMIKEADLQQLLVNSTTDIYDNLWLGGRYDQGRAQFKWEDGEPLSYTNWQEGSPRSDADSSICMEMKPTGVRTDNNPQGKWADVNCNKRNLVICQRTLAWTLQDAINEIIKMRKDIVDATDELDDLQERVRSRVVPVGSLYIQYYDQQNPGTLWRDFTWEDISSTYEGLFFRAMGGEAASWGETQVGCSPGITQMEYVSNSSFGDIRNPLYLPSGGWSDLGLAGYRCSVFPPYIESVRFETRGCEVRPRNQAVKIWKRTA